MGSKQYDTMTCEDFEIKAKLISEDPSPFPYLELDLAGMLAEQDDETIARNGEVFLALDFKQLSRITALLNTALADMIAEM